MLKFIFVFTILAQGVLTFNRNIKLRTLANCEEYLTESEYAYKDTIPIENATYNLPLMDEVFRLKFFVFAKRDAFILISNTDKIQSEDPAYEIIIGGWSNTLSVIRNQTEFSDRMDERKGAVLSNFYPTEIIVTMKKTGELQVIIPELDSNPYMTYKDETVRFYKYFSLSTTNGGLVRWFYGCVERVPNQDENYIFNTQKQLD